MADYIEREAAAIAIRMRCPSEPLIGKHRRLEWRRENEGYIDSEEIVKSLPAADVKPVTRSEWVYLRREEVFDISGVRTWGARYQCRNCGFEPIFIEDHGRYDFCPNCGSYNGGGEDG